MEKIIKTFKQYWLAVVILCLIGTGAMSLSGCAGSTKTSTVTTETSGGSLGGSSTSSVTQKEVTTDAHPRGVIGGIFYTIGQVLIWPFKVIGSLF